MSRRSGSALLGVCDRKGYTELFTKEGRSVILPTTCKTWGCVVCRKKLLAVFRGKVEQGCLSLGTCCFMTITYQAANESHADAVSVRKDWAALWKQLRRQGRRWTWMKVTEITKQGMPHHHIVLGPIDDDQQIRCHGRRIRKGPETVRYIRGIEACGCMSHIFARAWLAITGDSYMCFATLVTSAEGAGGYLAKYMAKAFRAKHGSERRYSTARDWPVGKRLRLRVTEEGGWDHIRRWSSSTFPSTMSEAELNPEEGDLLERVGDDVTKAMALRTANRKARKGYAAWRKQHDHTEG